MTEENQTERQANPNFVNILKSELEELRGKDEICKKILNTRYSIESKIFSLSEEIALLEKIKPLHFFNGRIIAKIKYLEYKINKWEKIKDLLGNIAVCNWIPITDSLINE